MLKTTEAEEITKLKDIGDDLLKIKNIQLLNNIDVKHLVFIANINISEKKNNSDVN